MPTVVVPAISGGIVERFSDEPISMTVKAGTLVNGGDVVELSAAFEVIQAAGVNPPVGVVLFNGDGNGPATGTPNVVTVTGDGTYNLKAKGAITFGTFVKASTTAGSVAPWVSGTDAVSLIVGQALESIADGQLGAIRLKFA